MAYIFKKFILIALALNLAVVFLMPLKVQAAKEIQIQVQIPGLTSPCSTQPKDAEKVVYCVRDIGEYISQFYVYFTGVVGILAAVMIVYGGILWVTAAGNTSRIESAKSTINGAIIGLILALGAYLILSTINPRMTKLTTPGLTPIGQELLPSVYTSAPTGGCPSDATLQKISDYIEGDLLEISPDVQSPWLQGGTMAKLKIAAEKAKNLNPSRKLMVKGAHRTVAYQQHLYDCYQTKLNTGTCPGTCPEGCQVAAAPSCSSPHVTGNAVDVCIGKFNGATFDFSETCTKLSAAFNGSSPEQTVLQQVMKESGFFRFCGEWWHFEGVQMSVPCDPGIYQ